MIIDDFTAIAKRVKEIQQAENPLNESQPTRIVEAETPEPPMTIEDYYCCVYNA